MKKTILILLMSSYFLAKADEPKVSMLKQSTKDLPMQPVYNPGKSAGAWILIGGSSLFVSGVSKVFATYAAVPDITIYKYEEHYIKALNKYNNHQRIYNSIFYTGVGVAGLTIMFGAFDLLNTPVAENNKVSLNLKSNGSNVGLCLNFK
jgi:hypothetical protein